MLPLHHGAIPISVRGGCGRARPASSSDVVGVLAPDLVPIQLTDERERNHLRLARLRPERHARLFRGSVPFSVVAVVTRGHDILPGCLATPRLRHDVVERQLRAARLGAAILAGLAVADEHGPARARQAPRARDRDVPHQADNQRTLHARPLRPQALLGGLDQLGLRLDQQDDRALDAHDAQGLVAGIEN